MIDAALTSGGAIIRGQGRVPAREYFAVLGFLAELVLALGDFSHHAIAEWYHVKKTRFPSRVQEHELVSISASARFHAVRIALLLLSDWPNGFRVLTNGAESTNKFFGAGAEAPAWYVASLSEASLRGRYAAWLQEKWTAYRLKRGWPEPDDTDE